MFPFTILSLLATSSAWAAPVNIVIPASQIPRCSISSVKVQAGTMPAQTAGTTFVTLGVGLQNYTCSDGKFV
jgi:hypothetical protein